MIKNKIEYLLKHNKLIQNIYKFSFSSLFNFIGLFIKTDKNLVLYNSMIGRSNYDSPKAIYDYLTSNNNFKNLKHVWAFNNPEEVKGYDKANKIKIDSLSYFITALKAGYWITNVNIERGLRFKKHKTKYLNTWHGVAFNHIGNDVPGRNDYNSKNVNFISYESDYNKDILIRALRAKPESMLPSGLPRNDELYNITDEEIKRIKKDLQISVNKKIILYAPTWRDSENSGSSYNMAPPIDFKKWENLLGKDYIVLLRTHHLTTKLLNVEFNDFVIDTSNYPKINDLFKISDILISDYSACIADFSILERPIICFGYDYDTYKNNRGFYIDFEKDLPIPLFRNQDQVINHLLNMNFEEESNKAKQIKQRFTPIGGNATEICVKALFNNEII